ncbi:Detected protein of confused Function [Hibiscus syriacus]|uniref:Detected protein of confused Function n=1 Tax=Hibiscus syriacus TaxID=106335 RepID=A0A6A2YXK4_HIBSY|nr:Detected protein of confused Function [Hibiscus syriacus]
MAAKRVIAVCQSGGEFETDDSGELLYKGGDAHAIDVDDQTKFEDFKTEIGEMFNLSMNTMSIKYFLPGNKKTLITVSNEKDLKRMIKFHGNSATVDVFIMMEEENVAHDVSNMPAKAPVDPPLAAPLDIVDAHNNHIDAPIETATEISSILTLAKSTQQWQNTITGVGQRFTGVQEFRETIRKYAIAHQFAFRYYKNDSNRVTVKCKVEGCPWRIHASRSWVASIIKERLKAFPHYKPKDIVTDIKQEFGIQLNYSQAWRGKEIAREQLQGSYKVAYSQLPLFCERIMETNPGSLATYSTKEDSSFHRLFIAFHACLCGFIQGCRPLLFLDSIPLNSKYQGTLLAATAADGDDGVFPVAFSVVDAETDENWHWFLLQLKSALPTTCPITFIADIQKGLRESISEIFKGSFHGYCIRYLTEQLIRDLKGQFSHEMKRLMIDDLHNAALAPRPELFQTYHESIKKISLEAYNWVIQSEPQNWANAYFPGARYNHMTSNFGELFYSWVSDAHELPITQMVDVIRQKIMELIYTRRATSDQWLTRLTPCMEEKLAKEGMKVRTHQVLLTAGSIFEVRGESTEIVDMDRWDCSCKSWQLSALPCSHAIAVITALDETHMTIALDTSQRKLQVTYAESIQPIPDVERPLHKDSSSALVTVTPPPTRRPPGRPSIKKLDHTR